MACSNTEYIVTWHVARRGHSHMACSNTEDIVTWLVVIQRT